VRATGVTGGNLFSDKTKRAGLIIVRRRDTPLIFNGLSKNMIKGRFTFPNIHNNDRRVT
jgi:hypothetical protein